MACDCGSRAERLLKRLGYEETTMNDGRSKALTFGNAVIPVSELNRHHFRLTLYGFWRFLFPMRVTT